MRGKLVCWYSRVPKWDMRRLPRLRATHLRPRSVTHLWPQRTSCGSHIFAVLHSSVALEPPTIDADLLANELRYLEGDDLRRRYESLENAPPWKEFEAAATAAAEPVDMRVRPIYATLTRASADLDAPTSGSSCLFALPFCLALLLTHRSPDRHRAPQCHLWPKVSNSRYFLSSLAH